MVLTQFSVCVIKTDFIFDFILKLYYNIYRKNEGDNYD